MESETIPEACPVCGANQDAFEPYADEEGAGSKPAAVSAESEPEATPGAKRWKCTVCGYIHVGKDPPESCPRCHVGPDKFVLLEEESGADDSQPKAAAKKPTKSILAQVAERLQLVTKLHGHPVAVHTPSGVLPLAFLFLVLAMVFKSEAMAIASKLNIIFVALAMPITMLTGFVDWHNRYGGNWTKYFVIKTICGIVVSVLALVLAIWWVAEPDIYVGAASRLGAFVAVHLVAVISVMLAGLFGGKVVFGE